MVDAKIELIEADITTLAVDAIVNAANHSLLGGGGVDGAIHRAAGPELKRECFGLNGCNTGDAKITKGYNLPADYVIHTVGPLWRGGDSNESELLASCYRNCMKIAEENSIRRLAFPAISTGAYSFPPDLAARIALLEILRALQKYPDMEKVYVVCFDQLTRTAYEDAFATGKES